MKTDLTDHDFKEISALIREEEENALASFRMRNFLDRAAIRLREDAAGEKLPVFSRRRVVPGLAAILVLAVAGAFLFIMKRPAPGPPPEFRALASALGQLPGFSHPPRREWTGPSGQARASRLAESVWLVLVSAEKTKRQAEQGIPIPAGPTKVPRLSLDQKMEILFKEKTIERALLVFKKDSKEI